PKSRGAGPARPIPQRRRPRVLPTNFRRADEPVRRMRSDMIATWLMTNTAPMSIPSTAMIPAQVGDSLWLPEQASTFASTVDSAWALVYWISVFFFVLVVVIQAVFIWKYRRRPGWTEQKTAHHNYPLELTWSIIPSLLIVLMFIKGFMGFL